MKKLYLIGGTMGVGKTTVCRELKRMLPGAVFLDGDWCWDADPFVVTEETRKMVLGNIRYMLGSFIRCSAYENIIFCWVMHRQGIIDSIVSALNTDGCRIIPVSLVCTPEALTARIMGDAARGVRTADVLDRSLPRLEMYAELNTEKIDVSALTPQEAAERIARL